MRSAHRNRPGQGSSRVSTARIRRSTHSLRWSFSSRGPRIFEEVGVDHAAGTGGLAGKAGEAVVDMLDRAGGRGDPAFEHVLDQVDAAARSLELVAGQEIGRTGGVAEPAVHAGAQHLLGHLHAGIALQLRGYRSLHRFLGPVRIPEPPVLPGYRQRACFPDPFTRRCPAGSIRVQGGSCPATFSRAAAAWATASSSAFAPPPCTTC